MHAHRLRKGKNYLAQSARHLAFELSQNAVAPPISGSRLLQISTTHAAMALFKSKRPLHVGRSRTTNRRIDLTCRVRLMYLRLFKLSCNQIKHAHTKCGRQFDIFNKASFIQTTKKLHNSKRNQRSNLTIIKVRRRRPHPHSFQPRKQKTENPHCDREVTPHQCLTSEEIRRLEMP